ncbi:MAG: N-acetylmuramidase domain-containing protein [Suipraeoptans sp.]
MRILRKGASGQEVSMLQNLLKDKGYPVSTDGIFGVQTHVSVCQFQKQSNLATDGIVGAATWSALMDNTSKIKADETGTQSAEPLTTNIDFGEAAKVLNVEEAAIRAVHQVESGGRNGFLPDGRPIILFEGHIFWGQLRKFGIDPDKYVRGNEDILYPKWTKAFYKGGAAEHDRLKRAMDIDWQAALSSASWGMFQIMGFNYKLCGYSSVEEYVAAMESSQHSQFMAFVSFLQNTGMDTPLRKLDWAAFARQYNGPGYAQNNYDKKLAEAYHKFKQ